MRTQLFHQIIYDLKCHFYVIWRSFVILINLRPCDLITTLTYVLMDICCPYFKVFLTFISKTKFCFTLNIENKTSFWTSIQNNVYRFDKNNLDINNYMFISQFSIQQTDLIFFLYLVKWIGMIKAWSMIGLPLILHWQS